LLADLVPAGTPKGRLMSSTEWCYQPYLPRIDGGYTFRPACRHPVDEVVAPDG
jgi:hypothetical protein